MTRAHRVFAAIYDPMNRKAEAGWLGRFRHKLLGDLSGHALEIGAGTGPISLTTRPASPRF